MATKEDCRRFEQTLPFYGTHVSTSSSAPTYASITFAPDEAKLARFREATVIIASAPPRAATPSRENVRDNLPSTAPNWMETALTLPQALEALGTRKHASALGRAAIMRLYGAWNLGQVSENTVLHVAQLVARARYSRKPSTEPDAAFLDYAGVLHSGLPSEVRNRVTMDRVLLAVGALRETPDPWVAVVEATTGLVGWKALVRFRVTALIRAILEGSK